jgi:hypothetical protein
MDDRGTDDRRNDEQNVKKSMRLLYRNLTHYEYDAITQLNYKNQ